MIKFFKHVWSRWFKHLNTSYFLFHPNCPVQVRSTGPDLFCIFKRSFSVTFCLLLLKFSFWTAFLYFFLYFSLLKPKPKKEGICVANVWPSNPEEDTWNVLIIGQESQGILNLANCKSNLEDDTWVQNSEKGFLSSSIREVDSLWHWNWKQFAWCTDILMTVGWLGEASTADTRHKWRVVKYGHSLV